MFGTDGIRGTVGLFPLDEASLVKLGNAIGRILNPVSIIIGRDTRESGHDIENALAAGLPNRTDVYFSGVVPTPGLSYLTGREGFEYGIMITASHNPYTDNGIKILNREGEKISDELEHEIEDYFFDMKQPQKNDVSRREDLSLPERYRDFLSRYLPVIEHPRPDWRLVVDCANGATYELAPRIFVDSGFDVQFLSRQPDGRNINLNCGSTYMENLQETVIREKADLGIAFDGDGDRVLFVDSLGRILNGDYTLNTIADLFLKYPGENDFNGVVVGTIMSNLGLEKALQQKGIRFLRTPVGDRYVYKEMQQTDAVLGGEQSGHTILRGYQKTGDGILTTLFFLKALLNSNLDPADIFQQMRLYPQAIRSIVIKEKRDLDQWQELRRMIDRFNEDHGKNSRIVVRYSGTEPKIRVMIESEVEEVLDESIRRFEEFITSSIGV